jgi:hypothetical protein
MGMTFLKYSAALIATYLVVANATNAGNFLKSAGSAYSQSVTALQGRSKA